MSSASWPEGLNQIPSSSSLRLARVTRTLSAHTSWRSFGSVHSMPSQQTQRLLLVAALNDSENLSEVLEAGRLVADEPVGVEVLQPAAGVAIVELDERSVRFRHPLMRSAVRQSADVEQRRRVHEALATTLEADADRRVPEARNHRTQGAQSNASLGWEPGAGIGKRTVTPPSTTIV
jgi:hypothetical protein